MSDNSRQPDRPRPTEPARFHDDCPDHEHFLLQRNLKSGEVRIFRISINAANSSIGIKVPIKASELPLPEIALGAKIMELADGYDLQEPVLTFLQPSRICPVGGEVIELKLKSKKLTGVEYLKSLPEGTRIKTATGTKIIIVNDGVYDMCPGRILEWRELGGYWRKISAENCTEWEPEKG